MPSLSEHAEHFLRQEFSRLLAVSQSRLEKTVLLDDLFPPDDRRRIWREAERKLGLRFPPLHLPSRAAWFGFGTAVGNAVRVGEQVQHVAVPGNRRQSNHRNSTGTAVKARTRTISGTSGVMS